MAWKKPKNGFKANGEDFSFLGSKDELAEERTVESRRRLREIMDKQIEEFLKNGGEIKQVASNTIAKKSEQDDSKYGNRPI